MRLMICRSGMLAIGFVLAIVGSSVLLAQPPLSPVVVAEVASREIMASQTFVGTVTPLKTATVGSAVDGRVVDFLVNEGDFVKGGQPLARLLTSTIRLELAAAEGELDLRRQELVELENGARPEEIEQANARMQAAAARSDYIQSRRKRIVSLFESGRASSVDERDQALSDAVEAAQVLREAKAAHQLVVNGPREEKIAQARARVAIQEAKTEKLRDQIEKHTIVSRFDGYVTAEHTEIGEWVRQGDLIAEITALEEVEVLTHVIERYIPFVRLGMPADVVIPALPDERFLGKVALVVPQADQLARTFPVKVRVENRTDEAGPVLKSGMYAQVLLPTGSKQMANLVPKDALVLGGRQPTVFVVNRSSPASDQGKVTPVAIEWGVSDGSWIQVSGPVKPGDLVVVQGNERLRPGQDVKVIRIDNSSPGESQAPPAEPAETK